MNKKQAVIIVTLSALIICMGLLATRLNSPLYTQNNSGEKSAISLKNSQDKKTSAKSKSNYFVEAKINRDNKYSQTLQSLKNVMEDKNISQQERDKSAKRYSSLAMSVNHENKIEMNLQAKGYEDAVCLLNDNKATVIVKAKNKLTDKQLKEIQSVVIDEAKIKDVEIQPKQ